MERIAHKQILFTICSAIVLAAAISTLLWFVRIMDQRAQRVVAVKEQIASYEANKKIFSEETKELKALSERMTVFEAYRITPATTPDLLSSLEDIARSERVDFAITSVEPNPSTKVLTIDFSAKGTRAALDSFLNVLQHQRYQIQFVHFSLHKDMTIAPVVATLGKDQKKAPPAPVIEWELIASVHITS